MADPELGEIEVDESVLQGAQFTEPGILRFQNTVNDFTHDLYKRSIQQGEASKSPGLPREVTQEHVRAATLAVTGRIGKPIRPWWHLPGCILEYIAIAVAGVGGGHLKDWKGILAFGIGLGCGVILIAARLITSKSE